MRWQIGRRSTNVEDRRGMRASGGLALGGGGLLLVVLVSTFLGVDPAVLLQGLEQVQVTTQQGGEPSAPPADDEQAEFVARVLGDTEDTWQAVFSAAGRSYEPPQLVLFTGAVASACGSGSAAMGPFYCPLDRKVYIDLGFFRELDERFGAPGDFARAYVIAHEVGHHVQTLLGISERVQERAAATGGRERNALSVRQELQADCLAG